MGPGYGHKVQGEKEFSPRGSSARSGEETIEDSGDGKAVGNTAGEGKAGAAAAAEETAQRPQQANIDKAPCQSGGGSDKDALGDENIDRKEDRGDVKAPAETAEEQERSQGDTITENTGFGLCNRGHDIRRGVRFTAWGDKM